MYGFLNRQKLLFLDRCAASSTAEKTEGATRIAISTIPSAFGLFLKRVKFRLYVLAGEDHWLIPRNRHMFDTVQQGFPFSGAGTVSQISLHNYSSFLSV